MCVCLCVKGLKQQGRAFGGRCHVQGKSYASFATHQVVVVGTSPLLLSQHLEGDDAIGGAGAMMQPGNCHFVPGLKRLALPIDSLCL